MEKLKMESENLTEKNIEKIGELFPNVITETKDEDGNIKKGINFDLLRQELSDDVVEGEECYEFTWVGKKQSIIDASKPIRKTLRPNEKESKNWETTENLFIEGDNLEVLKLLQQSYLNSIKMIYIDPPYNTGKDFVYRDNFKILKDDYDEEVGLFDEEENRLFQNNESNGRFHSDWCSMMYPRLQLARNLLTEDGVIFISIDDHEIHNLRKICDEIYGEENLIATIVWQQGRKSAGSAIAVNHEYIVIYAKSKTITLKINNEIGKYWKERKEGLDIIYEQEKKLREKYKNDYSTMSKQMKKFYKDLGEDHPAYRNKHYNQFDQKGIYFPDNTAAPDKPETRSHKPLIHPVTKKPTAVPKLGWRYTQKTLDNLVLKDKIHFGEDETKVPCLKRYLKETEYEVAPSVFYKDGRGASNRLDNLLGGKVFDFPKDEKILSKLINYCIIPSESNPTILDFFAGSSSTAHAIIQLNSEDGCQRKFIMVQLPENIDEKSNAFKLGFKNVCDIGK